jgi:TolB-like protein/tetratricopeptide (TPR) repeat protein
VPDSIALRIAVLPFEDQSPSHDHEWFSDGLTDELISTLNKLDTLLVLDRNSTRAFRNARLTTKQIARELQVRYVVLGAVRKAGEKIRVQASLIEPESGKVLWDEKFNGTMDDIFEIQEKTAREIVEGLKITLTPAESVAIDERLTDSPEAYELIMQASRKLNEEKDFEGGIFLAERAREIDPKSAAAIYMISIAISNRYRDGNRSDPSLLERERAAVRELMQIAPQSHYCYIARANYYLNIEEASLAVEMAERAVAIRPKRAASHSVLGFIYHRVHRFADAVVEFRRTLELDPRSGRDHVRLLTALFTAGAALEELRAEYPNVKRYFEARLAEYPNAHSFRMELLNAAIHARMADDAVAVAEVLLSGDDVDPDTEYTCAEAFLLIGDIDRGRALLRSAIERGQEVFSVYDRAGFRALEGTPEYDFLVSHIVEDYNA